MLCFHCSGFFSQPPLEFYLRAIASQPWSDVSVITFSRRPDTVNPTFAALEMMQRSGLLGPNVVTHKVGFPRCLLGSVLHILSYLPPKRAKMHDVARLHWFRSAFCSQVFVRSSLPEKNRAYGPQHVPDIFVRNMYSLDEMAAQRVAISCLDVHTYMALETLRACEALVLRSALIIFA